MRNGAGQDQKLYVGTHDGVCVLTSSDGGRTWSKGDVTPLTHAAARLTVSAADPQRAYLAAYESGVHRSDDGGITWRRLSSFPSAYAHSVLVHPEDRQVVYAGGEPAAIFRSSDGGETWEECDSFRTLPESDTWSFHGDRLSHVRELRSAPDNNSHLYAGIEVGGIVRSRDGGLTWQQLQGTDADVHLINMSKARPDRVYAATAAGPYRSDDGGDHWTPISAGLKRTYALHIATAPDDADLVLVSVSKHAGRAEPYMYRSTDGGQQWQQIQEVGSQEDMVVAIDWDPVNRNLVYAGTDGGRIYRSEDRGLSWEPLPIRLSRVAVGALVVAPAG